MDNFQIDSSVDKFKFPKKWFWIGAIISCLNLFAGLIYGIALIVEKEHRREGIALIVLSIIAISIIAFFVVPLLSQK